jgi:hypothetical protein
VKVQFRRRISKRIRRAAEGINLAADVNADVSVNVSENEHRTRHSPPTGSDARPRERGKETR